MGSNSAASHWLGRFAALVLMAAAGSAGAQHCSEPAGRVVSVEGRVDIRAQGAPEWVAARLDGPLCSGDTVRVALRSRAALLLPNETTLRVDQGTTLTLSAPTRPDGTLLDLLRGVINVITRTPQPFDVHTSHLNAGVKGTEFLVASSDAGAQVAVFEGTVAADRAQAHVTLEGGEIVYADAAGGLRKDRLLRPADAVQWALYYPTIYPLRNAEGDGALREAFELQRQGRSGDAIDRLDRDAAMAGDPRRLRLAVALLLQVGRADEAETRLQRALALNPADGDALALQAVAAITRNDPQRGLDLALRAVAAAPGSAPPRLALSYAQQASFRIPEALASAAEATRLAPENALAWVRLAELKMSDGNLDGALGAAGRAAEIDPEVSRIQTVLGFASLVRLDLAAARSAFEKAIRLDPSDALPHLGLGLAKIRGGALEDGRIQIEIAACLDPRNSLVRSYLGKAYFEEKRNRPAATQFALAEAIDPLDPTPLLYDAVRKSAENRPVEALQDLQRSIDLNDNRAVYRSRLLLDSDRAVRGANQARIYQELGVDALGVDTAAQALELDPADYSAHRFIADASATLPRQEATRVSELLQSQLLQPINLQPVQPSLSSTALNFPPGLGFGQSGFNEFTSLFERDGARLSLSGLAGNLDTHATEAVLSGVRDRVSYSLGQFRYRSEGYRPNNDLGHDISDLFLQFAATPRLNFQVEYRSRVTHAGDISQRIDQSFSEVDRVGIDQDSTRFGAHLKLGTATDLLLSYAESDFDFSQRILVADDPLAGLRIQSNEDGSQRGRSGEMQLLTRIAGARLVVGGGQFRVDGSSTISDEVAFFGTPIPLPPAPPIPLPPAPPTPTRSDQDNGYLYLTGAAGPALDWTVGTSYESSTDLVQAVDRSRWNPKLGLRLRPVDWGSIRLAAFETVKRPLVASQTLEPTTIAGFTQLFDDPNFTFSRFTGIAIDVVPAMAWRIGTEFSQRLRSTPRLQAGSPVDAESSEGLQRVFLYWAPARRWSLTAAWQRDRYRADPGSLDDVLTEVRTDSLPLMARYFSPSGLFARLAVSRVDQHVERFQSLAGTSSADSRFTLVNAALGYRSADRRFTVALQGLNLTDQRFAFQDDGFRTAGLEASARSPTPRRTLFMNASLVF